jgi:nucleotide-binding universal stress UspA family protein
MEIKRVVAGMDFSDSAVTAARWVSTHFAPGAEIVFVHSIFVPAPPRFLRGRFPSPDLLVSVAREGAEKRFRELTASFAPNPVRTEIRVGEPVEQISLVASECGADLVVVGKHGQRPGIWSRIGSTAEKLLGSSAIPVLLTPKIPEGPPRNILLALEDPDDISRASVWLRYLVEKFSAKITAVHVVSSAILSGILSGEASGSPGSKADPAAVKDEIREAAKSWKTEFEPTGLGTVATELTFGEPGQEILFAATRLRSDLIVIGRERTGTTRRALLGSVTSEVLREAPCPVLVVMSPEDEIVDG